MSRPHRLDSSRFGKQGKKSPRRVGFGRALRLEGLEERRLLAVESVYVASAQTANPSPLYIQWSTNDGGNGHAYKKVDDVRSWSDASIDATTLARPTGFANGQLATISSSQENQFLSSQFDGEMWFGFTDSYLEGEWRWIDDSPGIWQDPKSFAAPIQTAFVNWHVGEPNNALPDIGQDFGLFNYRLPGEWDDFDAVSSYLVEFKPLPVPLSDSSLSQTQTSSVEIPRLVVAFDESMTTSGGAFNPHSPNYLGNWQLTRDGSDISNRINAIDCLFNPESSQFEAVLFLDAPLTRGNYQLTARDEIQDVAGNELDGDANGIPGGDYTLSFSIAPPPVSPPTKAGSEFRVNTATALDQRFWEPTPHATAMDADGDFVVTWSSQAQDGDGWGVFAQRYSASGAPAGQEFQVNSLAVANQQYSTVAIDPDGDFVITWSTLANETDNLGVYARRYNAVGVPQGEEFLVSPENLSSQRLSVAAMDALGNTLIVWSELDPAGGADPASNIRARLFNADGVALGPSFQVNTTTADLQRQASVARNGKGQFVITWRSRAQDGDTDGVFARVYAADGTPLTDELQVNQSATGQQIHATVAMDAAGNFVVTWYNQLIGDNAGTVVPREIYARRFAAHGAPLGDEFRVNTTTTGDQRYPTIDMDQDGDFVIVWASFLQDGSDWGIYLQAFDATGAKVGSETLVNTTTANRQIYPDVAMDDDGDFVVAWNSLAQDHSGYGIYAQRFTQPAGFAYPQVTDVYVSGDDHAIDEGERLAQAPSKLVVPFSEAMRTGVGTDSVTNKANWVLTRNGVDASAAISFVTFMFNAESNRNEATVHLGGPLDEGNYVLRAQSAIRDSAGFNLDGNYNGVGGGSFARGFSVSLPAAAADEFRVNTVTAGDQLFSPSAPGTVAMGPDGDFVVVWSSVGQDGSGHGIYSQRHSADGTPLGVEFRVNTFTSGDQRLPPWRCPRTANSSSPGRAPCRTAVATASTRSASRPTACNSAASSASTPRPITRRPAPAWRWTTPGPSSSPGRASARTAPGRGFSISASRPMARSWAAKAVPTRLPPTRSDCRMWRSTPTAIS